MKVLLTIAYDGTEYCGWQSQAKGEPTVQQAIEKAVSELYETPVSILGASRTDSGVHALGQRASFVPPDNRIKTERLHHAINGKLPDDIRIISAWEKDDEFHVINDAVSKAYCYKIQNSQVYNPLISRYSCHVKRALKIEPMKEAALFFLGTHDFKAFCASKSGAKTTVRSIYSLDIDRTFDTVTITVTGEGFLYNMVRIIAGTLIEVGMDKIPAESVYSIIKSLKRENAGKTAPAKGLTLLSVTYKDDIGAKIRW